MSSSSKSLVLSATACERRCLYSAPPSLVSPLKVTALQGGGKVGAVHPQEKGSERPRPRFKAENQGPHYLVMFSMQSQTDYLLVGACDCVCLSSIKKCC